MSKQNPTKYMIVMRHGHQCPDNGLTETGKNQVKITAQALEDEGFTPDILITSFPHRAKLSASILSAHFNVAVSRTIDLLDVFNPSFDLDAALQLPPQDARITLFSGHDETLQYFGHALLDEKDTIRLFHLLPDSRILEVPQNGFKSLHVMGGHADALILQSDGDPHTPHGWHLYGWLADGKIERANNTTTQNPRLSGAQNFQEARERIDITIKIPDGP